MADNGAELALHEAFVDGETLKVTETPKLSRDTIEPLTGWLGYPDLP